jgi:uncharacterized repeat protein (TIGR01451 family)
LPVHNIVMGKSALARAAWVALAIAVVLPSPRFAAAAAATDLAVRATAGTHRVGMIATYTVSVINRGPAATDAPIHVLTTLSPGLTFAGAVSLGWTCTESGPAVDCVLPTSLAAGRS